MTGFERDVLRIVVIHRYKTLRRRYRARFLSIRAHYW